MPLRGEELNVGVANLNKVKEEIESIGKNYLTSFLIEFGSIAVFPLLIPSLLPFRWLGLMAPGVEVGGLLGPSNRELTREPEWE